MRKLGPGLAVVVLAFAAGCGDDDATPDDFTANFRALNGSGVKGKATLRHKTDERDELTVDLRASGLTPRRSNSVGIYGFAGKSRRARCPDVSADANEDRVISSDEAASAYGPVLLRLEPRPSASLGGKIEIDGVVYNARRDRTTPFENRVLVIKGGSVGGGPYRPTLPVACATINPTGEKARPKSRSRELQDRLREAEAERERLRRELRERRGQ
ncbi:MAG: hypothetical protein M3N16_08325 [Actinomycetota bacterium]|nr:hypothetical protein [Actinomycetota bacterium]